MKLQISIALLLSAFCASLLAAPAPWYKWRSKLTGTIACVQVSPGEGWKKASGPYKDAACTITGLPGK